MRRAAGRIRRCACRAKASGGGRAGGGGGARRRRARARPTAPAAASRRYIAPDPKDTDVFFSGGNNGSFLIYTNRKTGQSREVHPYPRMFSGEPSSALVERVQWTFPIVFSPVDPNMLYTATQHVWKTTNNGQTWDRISGDLTRHDPNTMGHSGGPITGDMNGPEVYATVFALAPSKVDVNVIWAGSDDGLIHVTRDGGRTWTNVTPPRCPTSAASASSTPRPSTRAPPTRPSSGRCSATTAPHLFRTHDFGATWTKIVNGLRPDDYTHVIREDHTRRGLLYAGTQHGVYYSSDDGGTWQSLSLNLPDVQISDLIVEDTDLVDRDARPVVLGARRHRAVAPVRRARRRPPSDVYLFAPADAIRSARTATIRYWVKQPVARSHASTSLDAAGTVVRDVRAGAGWRTRRPWRRRRRTGRRRWRGPRRRRGGFGGGGASTAVGLQQRDVEPELPGRDVLPGHDPLGRIDRGPTAPPGTYQVRLTANGRIADAAVHRARAPALHRCH